MNLSNEEISRYSRQLLLPEIGLDGQKKLKSSSVLIVGTGGLGSPVGMYLASAGLGKLGFVDYDVVEADSACATVKLLNSNCITSAYNLKLDSENALGIVKEYDIVVDASDNVATRYLVNDACVLLKKPLVSGSALKFEGQLIVYNYKDGPCYRCIFPSPPPAATVTNCSDGGVLGPVTGVIGSLQALEVIKILVNQKSGLEGKMLVYEALECKFRSIKLRGRQSSCKVCGESPEITSLIDYELFCGQKSNDKSKTLNILSADERISCQVYKEVCHRNCPHLLIDVRDSIQFDICHLANAKNIPLPELQNGKLEVSKDFPIYVMCRRGNASQKGVRVLQELGFLQVKDIIGGITEWAEVIDPSLPKY